MFNHKKLFSGFVTLLITISMLNVFTVNAVAPKFVVLQDFENISAADAVKGHEMFGGVSQYTAEISTDWKIDGSKSLKLSGSSGGWEYRFITLDTSGIDLTNMSAIMVYFKTDDTCTNDGGKQLVAKFGVWTSDQNAYFSNDLGQIFDAKTNQFLSNDFSDGQKNTIWFSDARNREIAVKVPTTNMAKNADAPGEPDLDYSKITHFFIATSEPASGKSLYIDRIVGIEGENDGSLGFVPQGETVEAPKFIVIQDFENVDAADALGQCYGGNYSAEIATDYSIDGSKSLKVTNSTSGWGYISMKVDLSKINTTKMSAIIMYMKLPDVCAQNGGDQLVGQFGVFADGTAYHSNDLGKIFDVAANNYLPTDYSYRTSWGNQQTIWFNPAQNKEIAIKIPLTTIEAGLDKSKIASVFIASAEPIAGKAIYFDRIIGIEGVDDGSVSFANVATDSKYAVLQNFENVSAADAIAGSDSHISAEITNEYKVDGSKSLKVTRSSTLWTTMFIKLNMRYINAANMSAIIMYIKLPDECFAENGTQLVAQFGVKTIDGQMYYSNELGTIFDVSTNSYLQNDYSFGNKNTIWYSDARNKEIAIKIPMVMTASGLDKTKIASLFMSTGEPVAGKAIYIDRVVGIQGEDDSAVPPAIIFGNYKVTNNMITNVPVGTTDVGCLSVFAPVANANVVFSNTTGSKIGTDTKVDVTVGGQTTRYTFMVYGDVYADGAINVSDLAKLKEHLLKTQTLEGIFGTAGDVDKSGNISISDLLAIKKHILGISYINQN